MIIQSKSGGKLQLFQIIALAFQKVLIDALGSQDPDLGFQAVIDALSELRGQFLLIFVPGCEHMPENAVQKHVQIGPVQQARTVHIKTEQIIGIKTNVDRVCSDTCRRQIHDVSQTVQSRSKKPHGKIQFRPCSIQYSFSRLIEFNSVSHK